MIDFLYQGGPIFTLPMTLIFLINLVLIGRNFTFLLFDKFKNPLIAKKWIDSVKYIGVFLLTAGILGQIIGLYEAFEMIESKKIEINPEIMAGGLRVSSITTLLGLGYFLISYACWFVLRTRLSLVQSLD